MMASLRTHICVTRPLWANLNTAYQSAALNHRYFLVCRGYLIITLTEIIMKSPFLKIPFFRGWRQAIICPTTLGPLDSNQNKNKNSTILIKIKNVNLKISPAILPQCVTSDAIWRHRSELTLAQVIACCLKVPSLYLNHCWLFFSKIPWHSTESNFTANVFRSYCFV